MKRKLVAAVLMVLLAFGMISALAGGQGVVNPVTGDEELVFDMEDDWGNGELGDESIPLYALCGLAAIAAVGAVVMHKKRQRVG